MTANGGHAKGEGGCGGSGGRIVIDVNDEASIIDSDLAKAQGGTHHDG